MVHAGEALWTPDGDILDRTRIGDYLRWLKRERGLTFVDYPALWRWSVTDLPGFWASIWDYFEVGFRDIGDPMSGPADRVSPDRVLVGDPMPDVSWFPDSRVNYAERLLRGVRPDATVVFGRSQTRAPVDLTGAELIDAVARARAGLRRLGVARGDRVAAYLPNIPETLVLLAATASLGAVFSSCAPEFGARSVVDRWQQIQPKVLVTIDGYRYGDKDIDRTDEIAAIRKALPGIEQVVLVPYLHDDPGRVPGTVPWSALLSETKGLSETEPLAFEPVPFDHPLYVLYSSGTTGLPKPIVHGHGGILLEHLKTHALHHDVHPGDHFFWFSTTGWMMWNFAASALAVGAAVVCFDGNPAYPDLGTLWRLAEECSMSFFGTSAPFLLACRANGLAPKEMADVSAIRAIGSTAAPLPIEGFAWVYENVHADVMLQSFSGGTDMCTGFVGGSPWLPVYAGELSCPCLGAAVATYDEAGASVVGEVGELVLERPMPSMPVGFWGDDEARTRYRSAYFEHFPGVWRHGDWAVITERGSVVISGRSDATLNRGGVRLGTAEFYSIVEDLPEITDSLVVHADDAGAEDGGAGALMLFVVLAPGCRLDDDLKRRIAVALRSNLSPRHVPDVIAAVPDVPRTLSGKKLEVPVKRILEGVAVDEAASKSALVNPEVLEAYVGYLKARRS